MNEFLRSTDGLCATLAMPEGRSKVAGVLILPGSGPVDRDGNVPGATNNCLKLLARALSARGLASLRIDKRGIGASAAAAPREEEIRVESLVEDAVSWSRVMRGEPRIERVFLLGHSEGALIATIAARRVKPPGLILLAGAGEPAARIIERQLDAAGLSRALRAHARRILRALLEGRTVADAPAELAWLFRPGVQPYLKSWLPIDPAAELARTDCPVLILQGTNDLQTTLADAGRLFAARPDGSLRIIEGMNHVLKDAPRERKANLTTYSDPEKPLSPGLAAAIAEFLRPV